MSDFLTDAQQAAVAAAMAAGKIQRKYYGKALSVSIKKGNTRNLVTNADKEADHAIRALLIKRFPEHTIITEEGEPRIGSEYEWHVDPLDGTTNYVHALKSFCASVALTKGDELLAGAIYEPLSGNLYTAIKGRGAFLNGRRIRVSANKILGSAIISVGLCHEEEKRKSALRIMGRLIGSRSLRMIGSGALAMCDVAAGAADAYFASCGASWDFAAAALFVREAGGMATTTKGTPWTPRSAQGIVAANKKLHPLILSLINKK